jgi:hypothetical protein
MIGRAPDLIHPISFRQWRLDGDPLRSLITGHAWATPQQDARCDKEAHPDVPAPAGDCACGIS